jgi:hypothetical protein
LLSQAAKCQIENTHFIFNAFAHSILIIVAYNPLLYNI